MNKLVLLSEVRKDKNKLLELNKDKSVQEDSNKSYVNFKDKFNFFQNEESFVDLDRITINNVSREKRLDKIMKRIFSLDSSALLVQFINSIYNDDLSSNTRIEYIKNNDSINNDVIILKNSNYNIKILAEDEYRKFEYQIQFQTRDNENIAIILSKIDLTDNCENVVNLNKKRREYEKDKVNKSLKENYARCLIMLNSNIEVPDVYEIKSKLEGEYIDYKINVIKSWKYDFKQLFEKNMYLLFPLKVLDLRKRLLSLSQEKGLEDLIKDDIFRFFKDMNKYFKKIREKNLITDKDINEMNLIAVDLLNIFMRDKNSILLKIKNEIEATLKGIVV